MLLLDSMVFVWALDDSARLGGATRQRLVSGGETVFVSPITLAELTIKTLLGKLRFETDIYAAVHEQGYTGLPLAAAHISRMSDFPELIRHDPFDRLLVAQAAHEEIDFLTSDRVLLGLGRDFILDATV